MAALILASSSLCTTRPGASSEAELPEEVPASLDSSTTDATESAFAESQWLWPHTWEPRPGLTVRLRGRIDTDAIWSTQSPANEATFGDLGDVVGLRRARIGAEGNFGDNSRYVAEIDLASGEVVPRDVYAALGRPQDAGGHQVGHFREPFSLEGGTSARYFAFMERSPINLLDPARNWGLGYFRENSDTNTAWGVGVFHAGTSPGDFQGGDGSTVGFTGRLTRALINENDGERLLHVGIALSERIPESGVIIINQKLQSPLLELGDSSTSAFVPKIHIPAHFQQLINLQVAAASGPLWTQVEWYGSLIDQTGGGAVFFHGFHIDGGYFLTGEHRGYDASTGTLGHVRVDRPWLHCMSEVDRPQGWGAWELTARFAYLDFFDPDTPPGTNGQRIGTHLPQVTLGLNWYMSDRVRLMFNYSYAVPDEINAGTSTANTFATRLAAFW